MKQFLSLLLLASFILPAAAEKNYSWKDCVKAAFENNPQLKAQKASKEQSEYSYLTSVNSYLPKISLSHSFSRSGGDNSSPSNRFSLSASLSQEIFDLKTLSSIKVSRISYETAELNYEIFLSELRKNLYNQYVALYFAQKLVEVNKRILEIRSENARLIKLKYDSGMESKGNMLYATAQAEMAKLNMKKAERDLASASQGMEDQLGLEIKGDIRASDIPGETSVNFDETKIKDYAAAYADLRLYVKSLETAKEKLNSAGYDIYPSLSFNASTGYSGKNEFPQSHSWSMGLGLSLPLFSGGPTYYSNNKKAAEKALEAAQETLKNAQLSAETNIRSSWQDYLNAADTISAYRSLMQANEERYKEGQINYMAGNMSFIDLENLEQNMIDSNINYLNYLKNANLKKAALERLLNVKLSGEDKL